MKSTLQIISIVFATLIGHTLFAQDVNQQTLHVFARSGLSLRSAPSLESERIHTIKNGETVTTMTEMHSIDTINGLYGNWVKVQHLDTFGYVFDAYLSDYPSVNSQMRYSNLKDYIFVNFEQISGSPRFVIENNRYDKSAEFEGVSYKLTGQDCNFTETLLCADLSVQEAFIIFSSLNTYFPLNSLDKKNFRRSTKNKSGFSKYWSIDHGGFSTDHTASYTLDKNGSLNSLSIFYEYEGGSGHLKFKKSGETAVTVELSIYCS